MNLNISLHISIKICDKGCTGILSSSKVFQQYKTTARGLMRNLFEDHGEAE